MKEYTRCSPWRKWTSYLIWTQHQDLSHSHSLSHWTNSMGTTCQISSITQHRGVAHLRQGTEFGRNKVFIEWKFRKWVGLSFPRANLEDFEPSIIAFSPTLLGKDPKPGFFIYHHLSYVNVTRRHRTSGWGHVLCTTSMKFNPAHVSEFWFATTH